MNKLIYLDIASTIMERIVLEVDDRVAKAWREASVEKKNAITDKLNISMGKELLEYDPKGFKQYLSQLRDKMEKRGLTQEALDDILKDEL